MASFRALGILPSKSALVTILQMEGNSRGSICFTRETGKGSRAQDFEFPFLISLFLDRDRCCHVCML